MYRLKLDFDRSGDFLGFWEKVSGFQGYLFGYVCMGYDIIMCVKCHFAFFGFFGDFLGFGGLNQKQYFLGVGLSGNGKVKRWISNF